MLNSYPNPFNDEVTLSFQVGLEGTVVLEVLDFSGRLISRVFEGRAEASKKYDIVLETGHYQTGMYVCVIRHESGETEYHKLIKGN